MCKKEKIRFLFGEDEDTTAGRKDDFRKRTKDGIWKTRDSTYATRLFQLRRPPVASNAPFPGLLEDALEESLADARSISRPQFPRHLVMSIHTIVHIRVQFAYSPSRYRVFNRTVHFQRNRRSCRRENVSDTRLCWSDFLIIRTRFAFTGSHQLARSNERSETISFHYTANHRAFRRLCRLASGIETLESWNFLIWKRLRFEIVFGIIIRPQEASNESLIYYISKI